MQRTPMRPGRRRWKSSWNWGASVAMVAAVALPAAGRFAGAGPVQVGQAAKAKTAASDKARADEKELQPALEKVRQGHVEDAVAEVRKLAEKHAEWPPARLIVARMLLGTGQLAPGRGEIEQAAVESPKHPDVYLTLGTLALGEGRRSDAQLNFQHAQKLIDAGKWAAEPEKTYRKEVFAGLAAVAEGRRDWKTAETELNAWLKLDPENPQALERLGGVLFQLGQTDRAFETLKQAVEASPTLEPAAVTMARLSAARGDEKKAREWFEYAEKFEPKGTRARAAYAGWLLDQGRARDARSKIDEASRIDPKSPNVRRLKGLIAWHLRDLATAEALLEELHRDQADDIQAANLLALTLVEQDDPVKRARGLKLAETNYQHNPRSHDCLATLGWAHYRSGHLDQAEQLLRAAVSGGRTMPDIAYYLARVLADKGQTANARGLLRSITQISGAFAHRDDARAVLDSLGK